MKRDDDIQIQAAARDAFVADAPPLLARLEEALLVIDEPSLGPSRLESAIDATRALEGTAELCHCEAIAGLAREMHRVLHLLRHGRLQATDEITAVLLAGRDQIAAELADLGAGHAQPRTRSRTEQLHQVLCGLGGAARDGTSGEAGLPPGEAPLPGAPVAVPTTDGAWHVSVRFDADALRRGTDPLALLQHLEAVGEVWQIETIVDDVPLLAQLDAEACHLGLELRLGTDAPLQDIEAALAPMRAGASVELLAPTARPVDFDALLQRRCGDDEAARSRLLWIWLALGVNIRLRDEPPAEAEASPLQAAATEGATLPLPVAPVAVSTPKIERRTERAADRRTPRRERSAWEAAPFVNVRADKLETLLDQLGELGTASTAVQSAVRLEASTALQTATQRVADLARAACESALALRRVPVSRGLQSLQALVEDAAATLGKSAELVIVGGDTDVEPTTADVLADALAHVLHNSLEHGIEPVESRLLAGKPEHGRLELRVRESAGSVIVDCSDDGRGLDLDALRSRAVEAGLLPAGVEPDEAEVCEFAFAPRLPRAGTAAGRRRHAAGLDAIRRNIESLRGRVSISSVRGVGTTLQIRLPLSTGTVDGVLALVGDSYYVIPLAAVDEVADAPADALAGADAARGTIDWRGEPLPCLDLVRFCGAESRHDGRRRGLVVVRDGRMRTGLIVDRVLGRQHAVLKPLAGFLGQLKTLAGSTVLGTGDIGLVLDIAGVVASASAAAAPASPR